MLWNVRYEEDVFMYLVSDNVKKCQNSDFKEGDTLQVPSHDADSGSVE